jgi:hypothetical protein
LALTALGGCGSESGTAEEKQAIDEKAGTYGGVGLDASAADVVDVFGESPPLGDDPVIPLGSDVTELDTSSSGCPPGGPGGWLRYEVVSFVLVDDRVCEVIIAEEGAATRRGVAVGDDLDAASEAYPEFECGEAADGEGLFGTQPTFSYCTGSIGDHYLWFGGDPVNVIELNAKPYP